MNYPNLARNTKWNITKMCCAPLNQKMQEAQKWQITSHIFNYICTIIPSKYCSWYSWFVQRSSLPSVQLVQLKQRVACSNQRLYKSVVEWYITYLFTDLLSAILALDSALDDVVVRSPFIKWSNCIEGNSNTHEVYDFVDKGPTYTFVSFLVDRY